MREKKKEQNLNKCVTISSERLFSNSLQLRASLCHLHLQVLRERTSVSNGETITSLPISIPLSTVQPNKLPVSIPLASVVLPSRVEKVVSKALSVLSIPNERHRGQKWGAVC